SVANLTDHDLVRIVAQDRTKTAVECQTLLLVHWYLSDSMKLILNGIFDGDNLVFFVSYFVERGVERCGFSGTRWSSHEHHAVRLSDVTTKLPQVLLGKADHIEVQILKRFVDLFLVENTNNSVFAVNRRHDRNTKVDVASFVTNPEASVLWDASFSDIQLRHDFDTRDQSLVVNQIDRIDLRVKRAVDSILHLHFRVACFDVNVRCARLHCLVNDRVNELDDRRHIGVSRQASEIEYFFSLFRLTNERNTKTGGGFLEHALRRVALAQYNFDCACC